MKDYIMRRYPDYHSSYEKLGGAVKEALDAIRAKRCPHAVKRLLTHREDVQSIR